MFSNVNSEVYPLGCGIESCEIWQGGATPSACGTTALVSPYSGYFDFIDTAITTDPVTFV